MQCETSTVRKAQECSHSRARTLSANPRTLTIEIKGLTYVHGFRAAPDLSPGAARNESKVFPHPARPKPIAQCP